MRFHSVVCCGVFWLAACGGEAPSQRSPISQPSVPPVSGTSPQAGSGSVIGVSDNPSALPVPVTPAAGGTGAPVTMMPVASTRDPVLIDQSGPGNPAGLSDGDAQKLLAGGPPGALRVLYPYDGTVFPRGMLAPLLMWEGAADAVYLHIKSSLFEYKGMLKPTAGPMMGPQLQVPQDVWDKAGERTQGQSDLYTLELSTLSGGAVAGPITVHFNIAQATVKGSIYYNTYNSKLPGAAVGGNVLRIPAGGKAEMFLSTTCNGCHSVAADGSRMTSQISLVTGGSSFQLVSGGAPNPTASVSGPRSAYAALYPDGSHVLSMSSVIEVARATLTQGPGAPPDATLYDIATNQVVAGTGIPTGTLMPMFSPDGKHLVFNDFAIDMAHGLALMDYDVTAHKATGYKMLTKDADPIRPAWPFFLPDSKAVVFSRTDSADFSGGGAGIAGVVGLAPASELHIVDIASGTVTILARAMGYNTPQDATSGATYLPGGADELHHSYFPTVSPVAAGGYFWVFFDSVRNYGNMGLGRQLWGAAIDIHADGTYTTDPSHPAFYLPGQEFGTGNHRAFAALDPCKKDGPDTSCTSGIDCCGGFCSFPANQPTELVEPIGTCGKTEMRCAERDERCTSDADCCPPKMGEPRNSCIGGFCAFIQLN